MNSLRGRVGLLSVGLTIIFGMTTLIAVSRLRLLEGPVAEDLSRTSRDIEAVHGMARAITAVQLAIRDGRCADACPAVRAEFERWLSMVRGDSVSPDAEDLMQAIDARSARLFERALADAPSEEIDRETRGLEGLVDRLAALSKSGMLEAQGRTHTQTDQLSMTLWIALALLTACVAAVGWNLSESLIGPLRELVTSLGSVRPGEPYATLAPQRLAELETVAEEYRRMTGRLEVFERLQIDALEEEQAKTTAIIESLDDGIIVIDTLGAVIHVNEVAAAIIETESEKLLGVRFEELETSQPHYQRMRQAVRELTAQPNLEQECVELTLFLRGRDHHYVLRPVPFRSPGGMPAGLILVLHDVTDARDQAARREHVLHSLSHELGGPLTALRLGIDLLVRDGASLKPEQQALINAARADVGRLQAVLQRLLDLGRTRAPSIALERQSVDLHAVIDRMIRIFMPQASDKGVALDAVTAAEELTIAGDTIKLTWALSNLLSNALRYTPGGGKVRIEANAEPQLVVITVSDSGPGIPPDQRARIFERFVESGEGSTTASAGLGLTIVRDIVEAHGGRIHLDSELGRGSRFTVELPRA